MLPILRTRHMGQRLTNLIISCSVIMDNLFNFHFSRYFNNLLPIKVHPAYSQEMEFADKIVAPKTVLMEAKRCRVPLPVLMILEPERHMHSCIYCTVLEFTAEEGFLYLPYWMLSELGYKVINTQKGIKRTVKVGYGVRLHSIEVSLTNNIPSYSIPKCTLVEYFSDQSLNPNEIRDALSNYTFIREDSDVSISSKGKILIIKILKVQPKPLSLLNSNFDLKKLNSLPIKLKSEKEKSTSTSDNPSIKPSKLPVYTEKLPRFLVDIMKKKDEQSQKKDNKSSKVKTTHVKNLSYFSDDLPYGRSDTPEFIEKYLKSKQVDTNRSVDESIGRLPSVYHSPMRIKMNPPMLLSITLPEPSGTSVQKSRKKANGWLKMKKERAATPLFLKNIKLDGGVTVFNQGSEQKFLKGYKIF